MDLSLIAALDLEWWLEPKNWWIIVQVLLGLNAVILVHEFGHFAVARLCGVKCEKFYVWFDINGWRIFRFRWGETEYGMGVLPLGGYVKMLGQEDNPAKVSEEIERAKLRNQEATPGEASAREGIDLKTLARHPEGDSAGRPPRANEQGEFQLDPRSYMAKSVPQRMAIISAGVIMNVIFAWIFASIAYGLGVKYPPAVVGAVLPGDAAWEAGLRVGDKIIQIDDIEKPRFQDLLQEVALGEIEDGIPLVIERPGVEEPISFHIKPEQKAMRPTIGVTQPMTTVLADPPAEPGSPAHQARPALAAGDEIIAANGVEISAYHELHAQLARHADEPLTVRVRRSMRDSGGEASGEATRELEVVVPRHPMLELGLAMEMGPIVAIQKESPAAEAGVKVGDRIVAVDGEPAGDPLTLPQRVRRRAGETVTLTLQRKGEDKRVERQIKLRDESSFHSPLAEESPLALHGAGIAYAVGNRIAAVEPGGPAAKAGLKPGQKLLAARFVASEGQELEKPIRELTVELGEKRNWPFFAYYLLQHLVPDETKVQLTLEGDRQVLVDPVLSEEWFLPERGFRLQPLLQTRTAQSLGEALALGSRETGESLLLVVRFLQKLGRQISILMIGGPGTILAAAGTSAEQGFAQFLIFLCILSANLAVINFLPIPVLDGGHMLFLALEGIRGKPVSERVFLTATYIGFLFILALMLFAVSLDVWRFLF